MTSPPSRRAGLGVPKHWTAAEAASVLAFVYAIADAIFETYEEPLLAKARDDADRRPCTRPYGDDADIPF